MAEPSPMVELEPGGKPAVLNYNVPEPTSYPGRMAIDLGVDPGLFKPELAQAPPERTPADQLPAVGFDSIRDALEQGALDPKLFPHLRDLEPLPLLFGGRPGVTPEMFRGGMPEGTGAPYRRIFGLEPRVATIPTAPAPGAGADTNVEGLVRPAAAPDQPAPRSILDLTPDELIARLKLKQRLRIRRTLFGDYTYSFQPEPERALPRLFLIETYRISSYLGRYGAGRTLKTFSLLNGERTKISIKTYFKTESERKSASSVLDSFTSEAALDVEQAIQDEQSSRTAKEESSEYELGGNFGLDLGFLKIGGGGGGGGSSNSAREVMAKRTSSAVSKHAQKSSAKRDVTVNTSFSVTQQAGEETATEREISNINVGRTLNYVFRQLNQEFISFIHLVDVKIGFFNGYLESKREVPLYELDDLLEEVMVDDPPRRQEVRQLIITELQQVFDYEDNVQSAIEERPLPADPARSYIRVPKGSSFAQKYRDVSGNEITVPGVILSAEKITLRTDGVIAEALLGQSDGLDSYSRGLQEEAVEEQEVANRASLAEAARTELGMAIVKAKDEESAKVFATVFPPQPVFAPNGQPDND